MGTQKMPPHTYVLYNSCLEPRDRMPREGDCRLDTGSLVLPNFPHNSNAMTTKIFVFNQNKSKFRFRLIIGISIPTVVIEIENSILFRLFRPKNFVKSRNQFFIGIPIEIPELISVEILGETFF
jgi:hypothetical protein